MKTLAVMITLAFAAVGQTPTQTDSALLDPTSQESYRTTQLQLQVLYGQLELIRMRTCLIAKYNLEECGNFSVDSSGRTIVQKLAQKPTSSAKGDTPTQPAK